MTANLIAFSSLLILVAATLLVVRARIRFSRQFRIGPVAALLLMQLTWQIHLVLQSPTLSQPNVHLLHALIGFALAAGTFLWVKQQVTEAGRESQIQEKLAGSESAWQLLFEKSADATFILNTKARIVQASEQATAIFGYSRDEILGIDPQEVMHPSDLKELPLQTGRIRVGQPIVTQRRIRHRDGHYVQCEIRSVRLPDDRTLVCVRDVTERNRAQQILQESAAVMVHASRLAHLGFFTWDLRSDVVTCTDEIRSLMGIARDHALFSGDIFDRIHRDELEFVRRDVDRAIIEKRPLDHEFRVVPLSGKILHMRVVAEPAFDDQGDAVKVTGVLQDITDRKFQEQALRDSEERFRKVFEYSPLGICNVGLDGKILSANPAYCRILGYSAEELSNMTVLDLAPPSDVPRDEVILRDFAMQTITDPRKEFNGAKRLRRKDGQDIWVNLAATSVCDSNGEVLHGLGIIEDISAKRQAEETLRELLASMRDAAKLAKVGHFTLNLKTDEVIASDEICRLLGVEIGTPLSLLDLFSRTHPDDIPGIQQALERAAAEHSRIDHEYRALFPDGEIRYLHGLGDIDFDSQGAPASVLLTVQDITDRKLSEQALRDNEEKYRATFETTGAATVLIEEDTTISLVNAEFERLSGFSRDDIEGKMSWTQFVVREDLERMVALHRLRRTDPTAASNRYEFQFVAKSGERRNILLTIDVIPGTKRSVASLMDITLIRQAEERFLKAFKANPAAIAITRLSDGTFVEANQSLERLCGYTRDELLGRSAVDLGLRPVSSDVSEMLRMISGETQIQDRESTFTTKAGEEVICRYSGEIIEIGGEACAVFAFIDLTAMKRSEAALRESEERYRNLYFETPAIMYSIDRQGRIVSVNRAWLECLGYKEHEVLGHDSSEFMTVESRQYTTKVVRPEFFSGNSMSDVPFEFVRKDGQVRDMLFAAIAERDERGEVVRGLTVLRDVTEQKVAERALQEERNLFIGGPTVVFKNGYDGRPILDYVSPNMKSVFGYEPEQFTSDVSFLISLLHPDDAPGFVDQMKEAAASQTLSCEQQYRLRRSDGEYRWVHEYTRLTRDAAGGITSVRGYLTDITDRKQAEVRLCRSEERFERVARLSREIVWEVDTEGLYTYVSHACEEILGYRPDEMVGKMHFYDLHPEEGRDSFKQRALAVFAQKGIFRDLSNRVTSRDGRIVWLSTNGNPMLDEFGKLTGYVGSDLDITDRRKAEEALRVSEERYRNIVETASEGICILTAESVMTFANRTLANGLGYELEDVIGHRLEEFLFEEDLDDHKEELRKRADGLPGRYERRIRRADGSAVWCLVSATPLTDMAGRYLGAFAMFTDITESKLAQRALAQSEATYRALIETTNTGYAIVDDQGQIVDANAEYVRFTGYRDLTEIRGRSVLEWTSCDDRTKNDLAVAECLSQGYVRNLEIDYIDCHGVITPIEINATLLQIEGTHRILALCRDITERRRAELALQESEERFRSLFSEMLVGFALHEMICDADGIPCDYRYVEVNPAFERLTGLKREAVIGKTVKELLPDTEPYWIDLYGKVAMTGQSLSFEQRSGALGSVYEGVAFSHRKGFFAVTFSDITERKKAEEELRKNEAVLRSIFHATPVGVALLVDRRFMKVNSSLCKMTGYSEEELQGQYTQIIYPSEAEYSRIGSYLYADVKRRGFATTEAVLKTKEGARVDVLLCLSPFDPNDLSMGVTATVLDLTDLRRAEEAIRKSERLHRSLVDLSPDGIYIYSENGIAFANEAFARMLKADKTADILGLQYQEFVHADSIEFVSRRLKSVQELGVNPPAEQRFVARDGSAFDVEVSSVAIMWNDRPASQVIIRDITDRKRAEQERTLLEEQLRLSQKLETIGTLAAGIAHDFNNLLVPVIGYTELVASDLPSESVASEHLAEVIKAAYRAKSLVAQILSFSRQQVGDKRPLALSSIVKEVAKLTQSTLGGSIGIVSKIDDSTSLVLADATQMHQVLMNLCVNASHAMNGGGTLTVSLADSPESPVVCPGCQRTLDGSYVHLSVADSGCGMDAETKKRIFDPFFTTKPAGKGSGLGLAVSHGIVTQHGGHICPESQPGTGSTFHIFLPIADATVEDKVSSVAARERGTESILVVDDAAEVLRATAKTLESFGYRVTVQASPEDTIKEFELHPSRYDLILTDFRMPGMNGDRLAVELLRIRPEIPILVFSGYNDSLDLRNAHGIGISDVLTKPVPSHDLHAAIRKALDKVKSGLPEPIA